MKHDHTRFSVTLIDSKKPERLSKQISVDENGQLVKEGGGCLTDGFATRRTFDNITEFTAFISQLATHQALTYGVPDADYSRVVTKGALDPTRPVNGVPVIARTREYFAYAEGADVLMLDYDLDPGQPAMDPNALLGTLYAIVPALKEAPHIHWYSSSSFIYRQGEAEPVQGVRGQRVYVLVSDAPDLPRALSTLVDRLVLAGQGWLMLSKAGHGLKRTLVDATVAQPERLDFCAGAQCCEPFVQRRPPPTVHTPHAAPLDTRTALPDLEPLETERVRVIWADKLAELKNEIEAQQARWVEERVASLAPHNEQRREQLREAYTRAVRHKRLLGDFELTLDDGKRVTVGQVLDHWERYHGRRCRDPLDPDYRDDPRVAVIYTYTAGRPFMHSHAHGGQRFTLERQLRVIRLQGGELHRHVNDAFAQMALDKTVYRHGGELVHLGAVSRYHVVTPDWLCRYLTELARFEKFDKRASTWFPTDCPAHLAKIALASKDLYHRLPELNAVITADILRPDGSPLRGPGYDPSTKLYRAGGATPSTTREMDTETAIATLWRPFADFPFVGPVDRGVFLSALLTAVIRPVLPTAPGVMIEAPVAGAGKTLLAFCLALLAGVEHPSMIPPADNEEETRKRMTALLRNGAPVVILDNIEGVLHSATLANVLTAPWFEDRILGASDSVSFPVRSMIVATGNNVEIAGDLCRRFLRARIDPQMERPKRTSVTRWSV